MNNIIDKIEREYSRLKFSYNNPILKKIRVYSIARYLIRICSNILLPLYFKMTINNKRYKLSPTTNKERRIIVSFTSFPQRIEKLWIVVETILRQSVKPDMLILWLSKEQFDNIPLPNSLLSLCKRGLIIRFVDGDIRSHKKYYYAFKEFPNDILITIDDDIFYSSRLIEVLMEGHKSFPSDIIAKYAYKIKWNDKGQLRKYIEWQRISEFHEPSLDCFFGTGGGTLFPPKSLYKDIHNIDLALNLCALADDVYVNSMARLLGTKVVVVDQNFVFIPVTIDNNIMLADVNIVENENDKQINKIRDYYIKQCKIDIFRHNEE